MSNNVWDEQVTASGAGIAEGTYVVTLKDIERENKVVQNRSGFAGKKISENNMIPWIPTKNH